MAESEAQRFSRGLKYTIAATGSLAVTGVNVAHVEAAPVGSTIASSVYGWNSWSLGFGASYDSYRTSVSGENYSTDFSDGLGGTNLATSLEIGKDHQAGNMVYGLYGDVAIGSKNFASSDSYTSLTLQGRESLTGRAGVLVHPNTLLYGLAGWSVQQYAADFASSESYSESGFLNGPTVGVGAEVLFHDNMSLKAEYRFTHLSAPESLGDPGTFGASFSPVDDNTFRLILSLKLGP